METRVPDRQRSSAWARPRFSYYTRDARNRDYGELVRESRNNSAHDATDSAVGAVSGDGSSDGAVVILDVNSLDAGTGYLDLGLSIVSPDENLLAYTVDTTGDEVYTLRFRDLRTGRDLPDEVERAYYGGAWTADSTAFFYTVPDASYRPDRVCLHRLGTPASDDVVVQTEPDRRFELTVRLCRSEQAVLLRSESRDTSECWYLDPLGVDLEPRSVGGRRPGVAYRAEHVRAPLGDPGGGPGSLLVVTDDGAPEFRLVACPVPAPGGQDHAAWREARPEDPAERLERVDAFAGHVVASVRRGGAHVLRLLGADDLTAPGVEVTSRFVAGAVRIARNTLYDATAVVVTDQSRTEPPVHAAVSLADGTVTDQHRHVAPGHDPTAYLSETRSFPAPDGTAVPATLVRHRDTPLDGTAPALVWGYGAYEYTFEPDWEEPLPSLLDRGVVFVHAHVRGGGEGGRRWWLDGRLRAKQHTFDDHIAVADGLAAAGLVAPDRIATRGLSAGGLLQGAVLAQRPDRWRAVVAEVPFVDVVTTMLDDTIPLTVNEWDEWGDPRVRADFDAMLAYSPVRQPAARGRTTRPPGHRGRARPPGDGARAGEVGGGAACLGPGVVTPLPVPGRDRRRLPRRPERPARAPRLRGRGARVAAGPAGRRRPTRRRRVGAVSRCAGCAGRTA